MGRNHPQSSNLGLFVKQLRALLWKSFIIRRVHFISTFFELIGPLILILVVSLLYNTFAHKDKPANHVHEYANATYYHGDIFTITFNPKEDFVNSNRLDSRHNLKSIYYAPDHDASRKLLELFYSSANFTLEACKNEAELDLTVKDHSMGKETYHNETYTNKRYDLIGIFFDAPEEALKTGKLVYRVKMPANFGFLDITQKLFPYKNSQAPFGSSTFDQFTNTAEHLRDYQTFTRVNAYINRAFIQALCLDFNKADCSAHFGPITSKKMPYPPYLKADVDVFPIQDLLAIVLPLSYIVLVPLIVKRITDEKSTKAKELLRLIGMSDFVFWFSHFLNYLIIVILHTIIVTAVLFALNVSIFSYSSPFLFALGFFMFGVQMIFFSMLITTIFNRPIIATIITTLLWIILASVVFYTLIPSINNSIIVSSTNPARIGTCFLPASIIWFVSIMGTFENNGLGASFANLNTDSRLYGSFTEMVVLLCMFASYFIYAFLIWYLDNVWPFQHGVPKSPIFFFKPSYWCSEEKSAAYSEQKGRDENTDSRVFEPVPKDLHASIRVENLCKTFSKLGETKKTAVDHLWLNIYENQLTVLLGHNGAGKTTTMNMITGMFASSSGQIYVNGFNVFTQTKQARRSIGLCPQENIIFNELNVYQHLHLFGMLKDYPTELLDAEVKKLIDLLKLSDKKNVLATKLSGGMKRKLSLGIALVGDTQTLILDEPTSGMDPDARRVIWDLLMSIRRNRTILLTTHYMEEADVLGDRIAIMNEGKLCCSGTPFFLKSAFGTGYRLRIAKQDNFDSSKFLATLQKYIPNTTLSTEIETEVVYCLDDVNIDKKTLMSLLPSLFDDLETNKPKYGIDSCGLSYSTLEDVFLTVGSDVNLNSSLEKAQDSDSENSAPVVLLTKPSLLTKPGPTLLLHQLLGLFLKRLHFARRYWPMLLFQLVIPSLIVIGAMFLQRIGKTITAIGEAHLWLNTKDLYGSGTKSFVYGNDQKFSSAYLALLENKYSGSAQIIPGNTTDRAVEDWILGQVDNKIDWYIRKWLYGMGVDGTHLTAWINQEQFHSLPLGINVLFETLLRSLVPTFSSSGSIEVESAPMLSTEESQGFTMLGMVFSWAITCLIFLPIAFPFLAASYILYPIKENASKAKLIQLMTGLSPATFWIANFIFDLLNHLVAISVLYVIIYFLDTDNVLFGGPHGSSSAKILYLLLLSFGVATIPLTYALSYLFAKPSSGFVFLIIVFFLIGFICNIIFSVLDFLVNYPILETPDTTMSFWYTFLLVFLRIVPIFSMLFGFQKVQKLGVVARLCTDLHITDLCGSEKGKDLLKIKFLQGCCPETCTDMCYLEENPFSFRKAGAGPEVTYMIVTGLLSFLLIILFETYKQQFGKAFSVFSFSRLFSKATSSTANGTSNGHLNGIPLQSIDSDVEHERIRVEDEVRRAKGQLSDLLTVSRLTKKFNQFTAVDGLSFGVHYNEVFGLLGVNGAGKTTTFSMLTGDLLPTSGSAYIQKGDYSLIDNLNAFQTNIGYCPQFDALLDKLTGEETLYLFARLRGVPSANLSRDVGNLIQMIGLESHAQKRTETYSGGNRRKLSIAIALIGNPPLLFLDEPSAGVDPAARRKLWQTLGYLKRNFNSSIVLTSHSMEECEALCSRIGIMVNGRFKCLGSTQHLRSKYGQGYSITISLRREHEADQNYVQAIQTEMRQLIPSSLLKDYHQSLMHYHVTDPAERWSNLFTQMSKLNEKYDLEDYFVSDTTLEQIFIMFARHQQ